MLNIIKKATIVCLFVVFVGLTLSQVSAYMGYDNVQLVGNGKLLRDFTDKDYQTYYKEVSKKKMMGWRYHYVNTNHRIKFVGETVKDVYNDGKSPVKIGEVRTRKEARSIEITVSGSLSIKSSKNTPFFGDGLSSALKIDTKYKSMVEQTEKVETNLQADPGTHLIIYYQAEGTVSNGVAAQYIAWARVKQGGFEYFRIHSYYPRIEIRRI